MRRRLGEFKASPQHVSHGKIAGMGTLTSVFHSLPLDWVILGGIVVVIGIDSLRSGVGRACALAAALPIALLLHSLLTKAALIGSLGVLSGSTLAQALTFGGIVLLSYVLVRRMGLEYLDGGMGEPIQAVLAGGAVAILFNIIWLQVPALDTLWHVGPQIQAVFAENFRLWWLLGAYAALAFARG